MVQGDEPRPLRPALITVSGPAPGRAGPDIPACGQYGTGPRAGPGHQCGAFGQRGALLASRQPRCTAIVDVTGQAGVQGRGVPRQPRCRSAAATSAATSQGRRVTSDQL